MLMDREMRHAGRRKRAREREADKWESRTDSVQNMHKVQIQNNHYKIGTRQGENMYICAGLQIRTHKQVRLANFVNQVFRKEECSLIHPFRSVRVQTPRNIDRWWSRP